MAAPLDTARHDSGMFTIADSATVCKMLLHRRLSRDS
jgi:hypothetical protein